MTCSPPVAETSFWESLPSPRHLIFGVVVLLHVVVWKFSPPFRIGPSVTTVKFSRFAFLLSGEIRSLRTCMSSQLELFNFANGTGIDIYAVLSPTTKHAFRAGEANSSADDIELAWLRSLPGLKALHIVSATQAEQYINKTLPGFPWTDEATLKKIFNSVPRPNNIVAASLKRHLVYQLMEDMLHASAARSGSFVHRYDTVVVGRPDIFTPQKQNSQRYPEGIQLDDYSSDKWLGFDGKDYFPGLPDSWAPNESGNVSGAQLPRLFTPDSRDGFLGDALHWGDMKAVRHVCNAIFYIKQLLTEEKGGPKNQSPVPVIDQGALWFFALIADVREATRKGRLIDSNATAQGIRLVHASLWICLGIDIKGNRNCGDSAMWAQPYS